MQDITNKKNPITSFLEIIPSLIFMAVNFISKSEEAIILATQSLVISSIIVIIAIYMIEKKISKMALISGIVLTIFGSLTVFSGNELFIKIKPTIVNIIFAAILIAGNFMKQPLICKLLGNGLKMSDDNYRKLSFRFAGFFIFLACVNEFIWRNFSTDFWVAFKVFGMFTLSILFTISQAPFIIKNQIKDKDEK
ncbi:septation protein A [Rickettsiales bacterium]|nr:septation protein A [Rickettsiales bacterium]